MQDPGIETNFASFAPRAYLNEYYAEVRAENQGLLKFFVEAYKDIDPGSILLEFGGGSTIYQLITAARVVKEIHFSDYLDINLEEVRRWQANAPGAYDWSAFVEHALQLETGQMITIEDIRRREQLLRRKLTSFFHCDAFAPDPLGITYRGFYDLLGANFVAESITNTKAHWREAVRNICSLLGRNGVLLMTALKGADGWRVGKQYYPATKLGEDDIALLLQELGFNIMTLTTIPAEVLDEDSAQYTGYAGLICLKAQRKAG